MSMSTNRSAAIGGDAPRAVQDALTVPNVNATEAETLLRTELNRFLALCDTLAPEDWAKPTACTDWNVRDILAHQVGGYASATGYGEMIRQLVLSKPKSGQLPEDALNALQLRERAGKSPAELLADLRRVAPMGIQKWAHQFRLVKLFSLPRPDGDPLSLRHLMWVVHSRDTWMHRLDICRATNRPFEQTTDHDGRIAALVMRDVAIQHRTLLSNRAVVFDLTGVAGGLWKVGAGAVAATIRMDVLEFNIFASGRFNYEEARPRATITGDAQLAEEVMRKTLILY